MNRPPLNTIQLADDAQMRMQTQLVAALQFLYGLPTGQPMTLLKNVGLSTTAKRVTHSLGRPMQGYIVVRSSSPAMFSDADATSNTANTVMLTASATTTVTLLFF